SLHQQARYAAAYAAAHGTSPPALDATPEGLRRLGDWIEATQSSSSRGPVLWALALIVLALGLLATPAPAPVTATVTDLAAPSIVSGGTRELPSFAALAVAGSRFAWRAVRMPLAWHAVGIGALAIAAVELALAVYKLHHRFFEMKMHDVYDALTVSDRGF